MHISDAGLSLIKAYEGLGDGDKASPETLEPYICPADVWTVGWGHALTNETGRLIRRADGGQMANKSMARQFGRGFITKPEADKLLKADIGAFESEVIHALGGTDATQAQFDSMVSFTYNCGPEAFQTSSILKLHKAGNREVSNVDLDILVNESKQKLAPDHMALAFARWVNSKGKWTLGLFRRRAAEALAYGGMSAAAAIVLTQAFDD